MTPSAMHAEKRRTLVLLGLGAVLVAAISLALLAGTESTSLARAIREPASLDRLILLKARLPRVVLAAIVGAGLAAVGGALQALLQNPLAEPYLLGVSGGAAMGATFAILAGISGLSLLGTAVVPLAALAGGLAATMIVYSLGRSTGSTSGMGILLSGVIVNSIASAVVTFAKTVTSAERTQELLFWLVGFLDVPSGAALVTLAVYVTLGVALLSFDAGRLNLLSLGEESAEHLGVEVRPLVRRVFFASSLVVGAIVSLTGLIGFVGLVVPHATRRLVGADFRMVLPVTLLAGASVLVLSDLVARAAFSWLGTEPPVGAVTALLGGPVALGILRRRGGRGR